MKKLLLTVLACLSLAVTACGPTGPEPTVVTINEVIEWDLETSKPYLDGQLVRIEDVSVTSNYGENYLSVCWADIAEDGETINDYISMEVQTAEATTFGWKDVVDITGTVSSTNGRPQLVNAQVEWAVDEETSKGKGSVIYSRFPSRAYWDGLTSRALSSSYFEATFQLASLPGELVEGQGGSYQVVFPGEKLTISDDNWNLIDVVIPTLDAEEAAMYNEAFEGLEVGDGILMFAQCWFDSYPKALMVPETLKIQDGWVPTPLNIFLDRASTVEYIAETYALDASFIPEGFAHESIYSWVVDDSLLSEYNCLNLNLGTDEATAVYTLFTDILDSLAEAGWVALGVDIAADDGSTQSFYALNPVIEGEELTGYDASMWVCDYTTQVILQIECPSLAPKDGRYEALSKMLAALGLSEPYWDPEDQCWYFALTVSSAQYPVPAMYTFFVQNLLPFAGEVTAIDGKFVDNSADAEQPFIYNLWASADGQYEYEVYVAPYSETVTYIQVSAYLASEAA